jgi:hypothetical protein
MHLKRTLVLIPFAAIAFALATAPASHADSLPTKWYEKAVKQVSAKITPAKAKPGQTVTLSVTVELNEGYFTYPTEQVDKMAAGMVNHFKFPAPGTVIFVGTLENPKDPKTKADAEANIKELRYYTDKATFTRKAVVSPKAMPGETTVKLAGFKLSVCDMLNCYPPKDVPIEVTLEVLDGPAQPVEKDFAEEVKQALGEK